MLYKLVGKSQDRSMKDGKINQYFNCMLWVNLFGNLILSTHSCDLNCLIELDKLWKETVKVWYKHQLLLYTYIFTCLHVPTSLLKLCCVMSFIFITCLPKYCKTPEIKPFHDHQNMAKWTQINDLIVLHIKILKYWTP